jgi:outer membrane protein TolC
MRLARLGLSALAAMVLSVLPHPAKAAELPDRPLGLEECIALARQHNPSLVIAREGVVASQANMNRALAAYYPAATLTAAQGRTAGSSFVETAAGTVAFTASGRRREAEVMLSQTVWQTGRREHVREARSSWQSSLANQIVADQELTLSVSQLYYAALAAEQLVEVAEATQASARDHEELVRARAAVGEAAPVDIAPAEADTANAEFSLLQARNNADVAKAQLKQAMGVTPTYRIQLVRPPAEQAQQPPPSLEEALGAAVSRRPEMAAARWSAAAGEDALRLARAVQGAMISLSAQYERGIQGPQQGTSWAVVASASAFLFDGGARLADTTAARANLESLRAQQQQLANAIGLDVESALLNVETARESVGAAEKAVESAEQQLAGAEAKYREGVGIFVEILDAQQVVTRARTNHVQATYNYQTALVALKRALGELVPTGGISLPDGTAPEAP